MINNTSLIGKLDTCIQEVEMLLKNIEDNQSTKIFPNNGYINLIDKQIDEITQGDDTETLQSYKIDKLIVEDLMTNGMTNGLRNPIYPNIEIENSFEKTVEKILYLPDNQEAVSYCPPSPSRSLKDQSLDFPASMRNLNTDKKTLLDYNFSNDIDHVPRSNIILDSNATDTVILDAINSEKSLVQDICGAPDLNDTKMLNVTFKIYNKLKLKRFKRIIKPKKFKNENILIDKKACEESLEKIQNCIVDIKHMKIEEKIKLIEHVKGLLDIFQLDNSKEYFNEMAENYDKLKADETKYLESSAPNETVMSIEREIIDIFQSLENKINIGVLNNKLFKSYIGLLFCNKFLKSDILKEVIKKMEESQEYRDIFGEVLKIVSMGSLECDLRFSKMINKSINKLKNSDDPYTCKVVVQSMICKNYVEDFISLRKLLKDFSNLDV